MKVYVVWYTYGSYDSVSDGTLAIYATREMAETHTANAISYHKDKIVPAINTLYQVNPRTDLDDWKDAMANLDRIIQANPWHPNMQTDDPESYMVYTYEDEVLDKLPV